MHRYLCTYRLGLSVGSSAHSVPIDWVEVLEVLRMVDAQVLVYYRLG